jgi:hypothetical protein
MLQGFIARSWAAALEATGCKHPTTVIRALHRLLWTVLFKQIWDTRNFILYHTPNHYNREENVTLEAKLHWYRENRYTVLAECDRHLAEHDSDAISQMGRKTKRKWIQQLDKLSKIHQNEHVLRDKGQSAITSHFPVTTTEETRQQKRMKTKQMKRKAKRTIQTTLNVERKRKNSKLKKLDRTQEYITPEKQQKISRIVTPDEKPEPTRPGPRDAPRPPEGIHPD